MVTREEIFVLNRDEVIAIAEARHGNPHHILGMHTCLNDVYVNTFIPGAAEVYVVDNNDKAEYKMETIYADGFYTVKLADKKAFDYSFKVVKKVWGADGSEEDDVRIISDAYAYGYVSDMKKILQVVNGEDDIESGFKVKDVFGARHGKMGNVSGTIFCMNMPGAVRVSVVGDFNGWDNRVNPMRKIDYTNIFELFIPEELTDTRYKFEALYEDGHVDIFSDPYATAYELYPGNASLLTGLSYTWNDDAYMTARKKKNIAESPVNIYEVHMATWKKHEDGSALTYKEFGKEIASYVASMGYNYVELMPVMEYADDTSWGYDTTGTFAPTSRYGTPVDFMSMVDYLHSKNIGIIMDMVPVTDVDCLTYWIDTYHLDGIRLDDKFLIETFKNITGDRYSDVMCDMTWNVNGVSGITEYMQIAPAHRDSFSEFMKSYRGFATGGAGIVALSHDETAYGKGSFIEKMPGGYEDKYADLRVFYGLAMMMPGKKLSCMGNELGLFGGFTGYNPIDWSMLEFDANKYLQKYVKELNKLYTEEKALYTTDSEAVEFLGEADGVAAFARGCGKDRLYVVCNFGLKDVKEYTLTVDGKGTYKEIFSSDMAKFGGEGNNNKQQKKTTTGSIEITAPALSITVVK
jgi:1,4-alpha-glucan branching enzyme